MGEDGEQVRMAASFGSQARFFLTSKNIAHVTITVSLNTGGEAPFRHFPREMRQRLEYALVWLIVKTIGVLPRPLARAGNFPGVDGLSAASTPALGGNVES